MSEIRTAGAIMRDAVAKINSDLVVQEIVSRKELQGTTKYAYCPYCLKRAKQQKQDYKTWLKPLWYVTYKSLYKTTEEYGRIVYENGWECPYCKDEKGNNRRITEEDFSACYSMYWKKDRNGKSGYNPDKINFVELNVEAIRKAGFVNYGMERK